MKRRIWFLALAMASVLEADYGSSGPMGNFSVNHYTRLEVSARGVEVTYVLHLGAVPTYLLLRDWKLTTKSPQSELEGKATEQARQWAKGLEFRAAGKPVEPHFVRATIYINTDFREPDGQAAARIASTFELPGIKSPLQFEDHNYPDRYGWKEIVIRSKAGVQIVTASHDSKDRSLALTDYPEIPSGRIDDLRASVDWRASSWPKVTPRIAPIPQPDPVPPPVAVGRKPETAAKGDFLSRILAPNHIEWQWMLAGLVVAFGLGGAHALEPGHGKTIVAAYLVGSRGTMKHAALLGGVVTLTHTISVFLLGFGVLVLSKSIVPANVIRSLEAVSGMSIVVIGAVMFYHRLGQLRHELAHARGEHHHHDHDHSHVPEGEVTLGSLIGLGVSGGLVPCPAALVIMLAAIAAGHTFAGLVLLVAFSLGLAGVLMAVGMMVLYARSWLPDPGAASRHPIFRLVPVLSAVIIVCVGLLMTGVSLGLVRPGLSI
ncbi:MAG TPA: sulfite exporter TauE/SafE family protein [Bryobacteraceae bacterium]|jgi:ABC-type nickel/cobalt efflux system permease component RcnA